MSILKKLKQSVRKREIYLGTGKKCTVTALTGKHQRMLTQKGIDSRLRFNNVVQTIIQDFEGEKWDSMSDMAKATFVKKMTSGDKVTIICEARQLSRNYETTYAYTYTFNDAKGSKQQKRYLFKLISEENRAQVIDNITYQLHPEFRDLGAKGFLDYYEAYKTVSHEEYAEQNSQLNLPNMTKELADDLHLIIELNRVGCFPTKPFKVRHEQYSKYYNEPVVIKCDDLLGGCLISFEYLSSINEEMQLKENSHKSILMRNVRIAEIPAKEGDAPNWERVSSEVLDELDISQLDYLRQQFFIHEGNVDTVEVIDEHPDETKDEKLIINLATDVGFFFPFGQRVDDEITTSIDLDRLVIDLQYAKFNISFWEMDEMEYDRIEKVYTRFIELQKQEKKKIQQQKAKARKQ